MDFTSRLHLSFPDSEPLCNGDTPPPHPHRPRSTSSRPCVRLRSFPMPDLPLPHPLIVPDPDSCYSAYEHSSLLSHASTTTSSSSPPSSNPQSSNSQPLDISLETIFSVALICIGLVTGMEELQPIAWRVWAGKVETEGNGMGMRRGGPWAGLEERMGFVDIRVRWL